MDDSTRRAVLEQFMGECITIEGAFDKMSHTLSNRSREVPVWTALLQDVYIHSEGKEIDLGHVWIQHAGDIKAAASLSPSRASPLPLPCHYL